VAAEKQIKIAGSRWSMNCHLVTKFAINSYSISPNDQHSLRVVSAITVIKKSQGLIKISQMIHTHVKRESEQHLQSKSYLP
jgi:hypothetical protein